MSETYEFNSEENKSFRGLVLMMRIMSGCIFLCGGLYVVLLALNLNRFEDFVTKGLAYTFVLIMGSAIVMTVSSLLYDSSSKFQLVIDTEGKDIEHLMDGLQKLNRVFRWSSAGLWILAVLTAGSILNILMTASGSV